MAGNHFLMAPGEVAFRKVDGIGKLNDLPQKVRTSAKALEDPRHLFTARPPAPVIVSGGGVAGSFRIFNDSNLGSWPWPFLLVGLCTHGLEHRKSESLHCQRACQLAARHN